MTYTDIGKIPCHAALVDIATYIASCYNIYVFSYLTDIPSNGSFQASLFVGSWRISSDNDFSIFAVYGKGTYVKYQCSYV